MLTSSSSIQSMMAYHLISQEDKSHLSADNDLNHLNSYQLQDSDAEGVEDEPHLSTEHDPLNGQSEVERSTTNLQALMHLLKGNIGTGILALPSAFKYGGLWLGFVGIFVMGVIATHCMHLLVACSRDIRRRSGYCSVDYSEVMKQSFQMGPSLLRRFANAAKIIVNIFLCITQFGFCTAYILFIAENICQVLETFTVFHARTIVYQVFVAALLIPYLSIRQLRHLSPFSLLANILTVVGLVVILQYCFQHLPSVSERPAFADVSTLALYFGIVVFTFEGIGVVLPIEDKMKTPEAFGGYFGIINLGMTVAMCLYAAVGFYGYLRFGDTVHGSITLDLPCKSWLYSSVKLMYAVAIFFTYGIQFYVPIEILWPPIHERLTNVHLKQYGEYLLRFFFLVVTFVLAATIPHLDLMISLVGTLSSSAVALIFPPLLELVTFSSNRTHFGRFHWKIAKDVFIILIGLVGFVVGTAVTINSIVQQFETNNPASNSTSCSCDTK